MMFKGLAGGRSGSQYNVSAKKRKTLEMLKFV
jgi:ribosomal protein L30/L7E